MNAKDLIPTSEAAAIIGCSRTSIENYRRRGWLSPIRLATGRILFVRQQVESLREELLVPPKGDLVEASRDKKRPYASLKVEPDPVMFAPEVWKAVAEYQKAKQDRR